MIRLRSDDDAPLTLATYGGLGGLTRSRGERGGIMQMRDLDDITAAIIATSLQLHRDLGPGLLESVYEAILERALGQRGFRVERQTMIRFEYQGMVFENGFRVDLIVDDRVLVEVKSVEQLGRQHAKQLLTYLKLTNRSVGLLINFGAPTLREGLRRVVNGYEPSAAPRLRVNKCVRGLTP